MNRAQNKNILIFLLASIGLIVLPHFEHIPNAVFAFFYLLLIWRLIGIWKQNWLPNKLSLFILTVCGLALLYSQYQGVLGRDAGTRLFIMALGLKLLEIKSERDLYVITYLAFIVAASQFLYEQSLLMAAYILFVCSALLATLICINSCKPNPVVAIKTAGLIIIQALPMAVVLFVLFPRVEAPKWMFFNEQYQAKTGLSDNMEPGSISDLGMSDELVFRVKFIGKLPPPRERYWRGPVLSYTDGKKWTQIKKLNFSHYMDKPVFNGTPYQYTLLMEPQDKHWVFALELPVEFTSPVSRNANYQLITSDTPDKRTEYNITSYPNYNTGFITRTEFKDATQLPNKPSDKITQLVKQLQGFDSTPENFITQLLTHFRKEDFHYTLTPPLMEENPIETFLFKTRYGFCSHYAAAFVYLMRVAHIPARVVTGYQGGEYNKIGHFLEIRQADAHAWAEVWLENKGWVRIDPTAAIAPERIEQNINIDQLIASGIINYVPLSENAQQTLDWLKQSQQLWHNLDYSWQRWVINYDNKHQANFLSSIGIDDLKAMLYWLAGLIGSITALLSWLLLYEKRKNISPEMQIYQYFCKKMLKHGLVKAKGEGAKDFGDRIIIEHPEKSIAIRKITDLFIKIHYGKYSTSDDLKALKQLIKHL